MLPWKLIRTRSLPWSVPSGEGKTTMLRLILSLLQPSGSGSYHVCAGDNHRTQIEMSPSTRKLFSYVASGEIPCFPVRLQKICETSNQMPPTKKSSTPARLACAPDFVESSDGIQEHGQRTRRRILRKDRHRETFHCQGTASPLADPVAR